MQAILKKLLIWIIIIVIIISPFVVMEPKNINANIIGTIVGGSANDNFGFSVSNAGDVNGDGVNDIIIGAPGYDNNRGRAYVFFGGPWIVNSLSTANANLTLNGSCISDRFGWNVSGAGDVNKDGFDDVIVGAPGNTSNTGKAYIFLGNAALHPWKSMRLMRISQCLERAAVMSLGAQSLQPAM